MRYYKNIELSKRFGIGGNTITRWIEGSIAGKNELQITEQKLLTKDKSIWRIISNTHNEKVLTRLFQEGRSKNHVSLKKEIVIDTGSLKLFSTKQISELINAIEDKHIPMKMTYMFNGSDIWNNFVSEGKKTGDYTTTKKTEELLDIFEAHLTTLNPDNKKINFFDVGCGNFLPVQSFINRLNKKNLLEKYIAVDISQELLDIAEKEALKTLRQDQILKIQNDFELENLNENANPIRDENTMNIIALLGSTIGNYLDQRVILSHLRESLIKDDLLIISNKMDSEIDKSRFNHILENNDQFLWIPALLGIDTGDVQFNAYYDGKKDHRVIAMKLDKDYSFTFTFPDSKKVRKIYLHSSDQIILWHHRMSKIEDLPLQYSRAGLEFLAFFKSKDDNVGMFINKKKNYPNRLSS